jgi:ubiquinone/menaquinone biosynthesis C-methylase UbiE
MPVDMKQRLMWQVKLLNREGTEERRSLNSSKLSQKKFYDVRFSSLNRMLHKLSSLPLLFYDRRLIGMIVDNPGHKSIGTVLDVGAGQGTDAILLSNYARHIVGIDISLKALKMAKFLSETETNSRNLSFIVCDAERLPFREDTFDVAYCKDVLHHVSDSLLAVSEMKRVSKQEGRVVAIEANACNPQMIIIGLIYFSVDRGVFKNTKKRLSALFSKTGLSNVDIIEAEFLPRQMLFEYRSPLNALFRLNVPVFLSILRKIEESWQKRMTLRKFSNYLIVRGFKKKTIELSSP